VVAVRDQGSAVDFPADPDAEHRNRLIARKADHSSNGDPADLGNGLRVKKPIDRFVAGNNRAREDDQNDGKARQVFHSPKAVGECSRRLAADQNEGDPKRDCGGGVADVVDRVGQQGNGTGREDDAKLQSSRHRQNHEGPLDRPYAGRSRRKCRIDNAVRVAL